RLDGPNSGTYFSLWGGQDFGEDDSRDASGDSRCGRCSWAGSPWAAGADQTEDAVENLALVGRRTAQALALGKEGLNQGKMMVSEVRLIALRVHALLYARIDFAHRQ